MRAFGKAESWAAFGWAEWAVVCLLLSLAAPPAAGHAQDDTSPPSRSPSRGTSSSVDLRSAHEVCVRSLVRIARVDGDFGSGWVVELGRHRYVVTNRHVVEGETDVWLEFYGGAASLGTIAYLSDAIDLALIEVVEDGATIPVEPLRFLSGSRPDAVGVRGERVVIGGNPSGLSFITTEGIVAGETDGLPSAAEACGASHGHFCMVIDAETEPGSSGGPVLNASGEVIGMIWGVVPGASFSIAIPASTLAAELTTGAAFLARRH